MESYDGTDAIERAWRDGLKPDPLLTVSEWADRYRVLSQRASSEPGRWRTERTPYLREIMDCLSPASPVQRVVFMKGSQTGGTETRNNFLGYVIHEAPGPMMAVAPRVELAKRNSKQCIDSLIEESEVLRARVKERRSPAPPAEGAGGRGAPVRAVRESSISSSVPSSARRTRWDRGSRSPGPTI